MPIRKIRSCLPLACVFLSTLATPVVAEVKGIPANSERYLALLERLWAELDMTGLDLDAAAADAGATPREALAWVARRTRFEPYTGLLRGARGTLLAGAGNSLDRALLLGELLVRQGRTVRFAAATLDTTTAEKLVRTLVVSRQPPGNETPLATEVRERAMEQFLILGDALHDAKVYAPPADNSVWKELVEAARAHAWVEVQENGNWIPLDPAAGVESGKSLAAAEQTFASFKDDLQHRVTLSLVAEFSEDNKRRLETLLEENRTSADWMGEPVGLYFEIAGGKATPLLVVGEKTLQGKIIPTIGEPQGGDLLPLPGLGGAGPSPVTGLWLRFAVTGPGRKENAECVLFDALGAEARRKNLPPPKQAPALAEAVEAVYGAAVSSAFPDPQVSLAFFTSVGDPFTSDGVARLLSGMAVDYLATRGFLPATLLEPPAVAIVDAPNIVITRARLRARDKSSPRIDVAMDLTLRSELLVRAPEDPLGKDTLFFDRLSSAVLDHTLERLALGDGGPDQSVGHVLESAHAEGIRLVTLTPKSGSGAPPLGRNGAVRAALEVEKGHVVLLPERAPPGFNPGELGWWTINPRTGRAHDLMETGWRQAMTDKAIQDAENIKNRRLACIFALKVIIKVAIPMVTLYGGLPPETANIIDELKIDEILDIAEKRACGTPGPDRIDRLPPGAKRFPPRPPNPRNPAPNLNKNTPATRWPPGAPRGG